MSRVRMALGGVLAGGLLLVGSGLAAGTSVLAHGAQRSERACVGAFVSEEARTGRGVGEEARQEAKAGREFGQAVSGFARTCEFPAGG